MNVKGYKMSKKLIAGLTTAVVLGMASTASAGVIGVFGDYSSSVNSLTSNLSSLGQYSDQPGHKYKSGFVVV